MATRKRPPLSDSRAEYVDGRSSGRLVGEPLYYPAAPADQYGKEMRKLIREMNKDYREALLSKYDEVEEQQEVAAEDVSMASQLRMRLNKLKDKWSKIFTDRAPAMVSSMINRVDQAEQKSLNASLKQLSGGFTIKTDIMPADLTEALTAATNENVSLIKSIQQQYHTQVEGFAMRSIHPGGRGAADIKEGLTNQLGVNDRRATRIATDQTKKITASMNYERSKALGIKKFKWVHSGRNAEPRPLHKNTLNGKIFSYDDLPVIDEKTGERGLPGKMINCSCVSVPVVEW